ncbi:MAG: peptidoglycan-binding domain-containing protein, partial [Patescibacteria group bacterium]
MSTIRNKFVSAALSGAIILSTAGVALPVAHAQSVADLQAQISALLAQIQQLQAQLSGVSGGAGVAVSCSFSRDLTLGSSGSDVNCLQRYLNSSGYQVAASGAGSPGNESSYFGSLSKAALMKWQSANGVSPALGYFGPISRAKYASLAVGAAPSAPVPGAPASGLSVSLAAENPPAGSLISSSGSAAARVPVLAVRLTAGVASG